VRISVEQVSVSWIGPPKDKNPQAEACGNTQNAVILSEAKNLSLFFLFYLNLKERFFAPLRMTEQVIFSAGCEACALLFLLNLFLLTKLSGLKSACFLVPGYN